jgi:tetratricopeptide (TPR) repeat protein
MFDSGVNPDDVDRLFLDRSEVAVFDDKVWIPVEATLVGKPFFSAWKQGALKYSQMKADQFINEINMTKAMAKYLPGSIAPEEVYIPDPTGVSELLEEDIRQYIKWLDQVVAKGIEGKLETADDYYDVAVLYMEFGRYQSAIDNLNTAMNITPNFPDALNTLGVCYTKQEEYETSIEFYNKALEQQSNHPGFMLNIAISQFMLGNKGLAKQTYDEVVQIAPSFSGKLEDILGAAKASMGPMASSNTINLSADLEADLDAESSKGLNDLKESAPKLEPEAVQRASYRARRAKSDNAVGITFAQIGNNAMAVDYFRKALDKDSENDEYKINLAVALYRVRNYDKAFQIFEEVKLKSPELVGQVSFIETMGEKPSKYKKFD